LEATVLAEKELKTMPLDNRVAVFDSVSTLLLYNKAESVERFVHNLAGKIRNLQTIAILLMVHLEEEKDTIRVISQFCDKTIEISESESKSE
jgi:archaellum biogenesis ATPase FlaH